jgi:dihydrofolate synthase/folylpolyglutamate synthase
VLFSEVLDEIFSRKAKHKGDIKLLHIRNVLHRLGDPDFAFKSVVISGTNGKTSTARILESILRSFGFKTGLFTSPHLVSVTERIAVNGSPISEEQFTKIYEQVIPIVEEYEEELVLSEEATTTLSFFEVLTVMSIVAFASENVHFAVVEVGLGGRYDATNVLNSEVCIIAPIDYDHQEYLGSSLEQIAYEKAGIIRNADIIVLSEQAETVQEILSTEVEKAEKSAVFVQNRDFRKLDDYITAPNSTGGIMNIQTSRGIYENLYLNLLGDYQVTNASLAIVAAEELIARDGHTLGFKALELALQDVTSPGRLEVLSFEPLIVIDVSHNPHGAENMVNSFRTSFEYDYVIAVVGISKDKDTEKMFEHYEDLLDCIILSENSSDQHYSTEDLKRIALKHYDQNDVYEKTSVNDAIDFAFELADDMHDLKVAILITGSVITVGDALIYMQKPKFQRLLDTSS